MQEIFICCAESRVEAGRRIAGELELLDAVQVFVEICEPGGLPQACEAAGDAAGVILLLSADAVPASMRRESWAPVLRRVEAGPGSIASVLLESCAFPQQLRSRALFVTDVGEAGSALRRWAVAAGGGSMERFEVRGVEDQYEFRDTVWIPCAGRERVSVEEDLRRAADGRRVLILLDGAPADLVLPALTREVVRPASPVAAVAPASSGEGELKIPAVVAACYPDFLDRDFCARLAGVEPEVLSRCLPAVSCDGRFLQVPQGLRRRLAVDAAPRKRHAELVLEYLAGAGARDELRTIRLELPAALAFSFATDWNSAANLTWRAYQALKEEYPREAGMYLLKLRESALANSVGSWVQLCERELQWLGVELPAAPEVGRGRKKGRDDRQLSLGW